MLNFMGDAINTPNYLITRLMTRTGDGSKINI